MRIKALALAALTAVASFLAPAPARAVECDQLSVGIGVCLPRYGTDFDQWATATINAFTLLNSSAAVIGSTTTYNALGWIAVNRISGMSVGTPQIRISSSVYADAGLYLRWLGSATVEGTGGLGVTYGITAGTGTFTGLMSAGSAAVSGGLTASSVTATTTGGTSFAVGMSTSARFTQGTTNIGILWADGSKTTTAWVASGSGHTLATGTISGSSVTGRAEFTQRAGLIFDAAGFALTDSPDQLSTLVQSKGYQYLTSSQTIIAPDTTFTNTTLGPCIAGTTITWTQGNNRALIYYSGSYISSANDQTHLGFLIDGQFVGGQSATASLQHTQHASNIAMAGTFHHVTSVLSAGEHKACLTGAVGSGTGQVGDTAFPLDDIAYFGVLELNTGGSGFSTAVSTHGLISAAATASLTYGACTGSTYTFTGTGAPIAGEVTLTGTAANGSINKYWLLMDGAPIPPWTASAPMLVQTGANTGQTITFSVPFRVNSPSAGSHSFCLTGTQAGADSIACNAGPCYLTVGEVRNGPGTGDVSSNGNNTLSGANSFTGTTSFSNTVSIGTMAISGTVAPPNSQALCLLAGQLGHCTSVVGATGGCTCVAP